MSHGARSLLRPHQFALVGAGGAGGGLLRYGLTAALPDRPGALPWTTFAINVIGSFALGLLIAGLVARRGAPAWVRPAVGTGLIGGFTTFSAYAHAVDLLVAGGLAAIAVAYLVGSVLGGVVGAAAGIAVGVRLPVRSEPTSGSTGGARSR